jgi:hypothetical protein
MALLFLLLGVALDGPCEGKCGLSDSWSLRLLALLSTVGMSWAASLFACRKKRWTIVLLLSCVSWIVLAAWFRYFKNAVPNIA